MRNRRDRRGANKLVLHVTNRTISGLPFVCRLFMSLIIRMLLAKAQTLFQVQICHFQWMGNHFHMILAGRAAAISLFMGYFQGEVAKYIKLVFPKLYKGAFWCGRFKEQRLCTAMDVMNKIIYIYANPTRANLVKTISDWPGVSSWKMYKEGACDFSACFVTLRNFRKIAKRLPSLKDSKAVNVLHSMGTDVYNFQLYPNVWKRCFVESKHWSDEYIYNTIMSRIAEREKLLAQERGSRAVLGTFALRHQAIRQDYEPKSKHKTPFIICHDPELRIRFIQSYREFCLKCRQAWEKWRLGLLDVIFPPGCYRPGMSVVMSRA